MVVVTLLPVRVVVAVVAVVLFLPGKRGRFLRDGLPSSDGWEGPETTVGTRVPPLAATLCFALAPFLFLSSSLLPCARFQSARHPRRSRTERLAPAKATIKYGESACGTSKRDSHPPHPSSFNPSHSLDTPCNPTASSLSSLFVQLFRSGDVQRAQGGP